MITHRKNGLNRYTQIFLSNARGMIRKELIPQDIKEHERLYRETQRRHRETQRDKEKEVYMRV